MSLAAQKSQRPWKWSYEMDFKYLIKAMCGKTLLQRLKMKLFGFLTFSKGLFAYLFI